jgi:hypothetical protein
MEARHPNHPGEMGTDAALAEAKRQQGELNARAHAIQKLTEAGVPFVVGGAYAYAHYTGIYRDTKDLDLFPRQADALRALEVLAADGWRTERTDEVWLYKAFRGEWFVDLIFSSGNGVAAVDDAWFANAQRGVVFDQQVLIAPAEEMIWSKAFVLERERFDGSDVMHLIRAAGPKMDWERVLRRFDRHWEVLLAHLQLFRFAYPCERSTVPRWLMVELLSRSLRSAQEGDWAGKMCRGNLLSRVNFEVDIKTWGYQDGRRWDEQKRAEGVDGAGSDREGPAGSRR